MKTILRPLPVLYACQGCAEFGRAARDAGELLDRLGLVELVWLGTRGAAEARPSERYPLFTLDGCGRACARRWLTDRGVTPQRGLVLAG